MFGAAGPASQQNSTLASAFRKQACCSSTDQGGGMRRGAIQFGRQVRSLAARSRLRW